MTTLCATVLLAAVNGLATCPPPVHEMPVLVTWYDPRRGGINCDVDCATFATCPPVTPDAYGTTAACIPQWLGGTVTVAGVGAFRCRDTGGAIRVRWNEYYRQWVIHLDLLLPEEPGVNYWLFSEWRLTWQ